MEEEELPLPGSRGAYNIDFDNLDEINPFQSNTKLGSSPPITSNAINPFQSRNKLRSSPPPTNLTLNDCNENQIKSEDVDLVNENSAQVERTETENGSSKGTKNLRSPEELSPDGSDVKSESMETSDASLQKENPKKAPRYLHIIIIVYCYNVTTLSVLHNFLSRDFLWESKVLLRIK